MHPFSTLRKHQKTSRFSDVFREWRKGVLETNGLINHATPFSILTRFMLHLVGSILRLMNRRQRHTPTHMRVPVTPVHVQINSGEKKVIYKDRILLLSFREIFFLNREHIFSMHAKCSEKLTFLTP